MNVILRLKGIKKEEIIKIDIENKLVVVKTLTKKHYFTIENKKGAFIVVQKDTKLICQECKPFKREN